MKTGFDRVVELQSKQSTRDAAGGEVVTWMTVKTFFAKKRDTTGTEQYRAGKTTPESETVFRSFWHDVYTVQRLRCEGVSYDILHVAEFGRREGIDMTVKRVP